MGLRSFLFMTENNIGKIPSGVFLCLFYQAVDEAVSFFRGVKLVQFAVISISNYAVDNAIEQFLIIHFVYLLTALIIIPLNIERFFRGNQSRDFCSWRNGLLVQCPECEI